MASLPDPTIQNASRAYPLNWPNGRAANPQMQPKYMHADNSRDADALQSRFKFNEDSASSASGTVNDDQNLPAEVLKTALCFLFMAVVLVANLLSAAVVHDRTPNKNGTEEQYPPLRDIGYDIGVVISGGGSSSSSSSNDLYFLAVSEVILLVSIALVACLLSFHKHRSIVFRRVFFLLALLFLVRLLTMNMTMLPVSSATAYRCNSKHELFAVDALASRFVDLLSMCGLPSLAAGGIRYCGNYVYSGYTVVLVLNTLVVAEYCPLWLVNMPLRLLTACSVCLILVSGFDYTISVITAYYITTRLFWIYHTMANSQSLRESRETNVNQICKEWWFPVFRFLEGNVRAVVPPMDNTFR